MKVQHNEDGQTTILLSVIMATVLMGFVGLSVDVQYMYHAKRMAQGAADAAAVAAAEQLTAGNSFNELTVAKAMAKLNGFDTTASTYPATVTIATPNAANSDGSTASYVANSYVQVTVSKPVPAAFMSVVTHQAGKTVTISATAVAGGGLSSPTCVCLLGPTGNTLNMSNNAQLNANSCGITIDSNSGNSVQVVGSATVNALSISSVGTNWNNTTNINNGGSISPTTKVIQGISTKCNPNIPAPVLPTGTACYANPIQGWNAANNYTGIYNLPLAGEVATNNTICFNSLDTSQSAKVNFAPGYTYYIKGDFGTGGGAPLAGSGVTFYVGGNVNIANGVTSTLSAPTVASIPQTLFWVNGTNVTIQGGSSSNLSGLLFAPNAAVTMNNGTGTTLNMDFVAQTLTMAGGATLNSYASSNLGNLNFSSAKLTQ